MNGSRILHFAQIAIRFLPYFAGKQDIAGEARPILRSTTSAFVSLYIQTWGHPMKRLVITLAAAALSAPAFAQAPEFSTVDVDQSGGVTWEEVQAAMPEITEEQFQAADADESGDLSEEEFQNLVSGQ
jgi:hypothetical protein